MSLASRLREEGRAEGRAEGLAEGLVEGIWIGKLQVLELHMGLPATEAAELWNLDAAALEARFSALQRKYCEGSQVVS
jgi:hypothetical protein